MSKLVLKVCSTTFTRKAMVCRLNPVPRTSVLQGALILVVGFATFCCGWEQVQAQLIPAIVTRRFEAPFQYLPSDPWTRSKAIQVQTKHYGFFYNCDGEECKRNSPYIKWQAHCDTDLPEKKGCLDLWKREIGQIKQRISDGSCACGQAGCDCK